MFKRFAKITAIGVCLASGMIPPVSAAPGSSTLTVNVAGVRNATGRVIVTLCRQGEAFPGGCKTKTTARALKGVTQVKLPAMQAGTYAIAVFHDENNDGKLTFIKEGIGFSNNSNLAFAAPKFAPASFQVRGATAIRVNLKYYG